MFPLVPRDVCLITSSPSFHAITAPNQLTFLKYREFLFNHINIQNFLSSGIGQNMHASAIKRKWGVKRTKAEMQRNIGPVRPLSSILSVLHQRMELTLQEQTLSLD